MANNVRAHDNFTELPGYRARDPHAPIVAVLDWYNEDLFFPNSTSNKGISHGEISAQAASQHGYNVLRLQCDITLNPDDTGDLDKPIAEITKSIKDGSITLGKGDVVNISLTNWAPAFTEVSKWLGMEITPQNLKYKRSELIDRMKTLSGAESTPPEIQKKFLRAIHTNAAIDELQKLGVEVVHSAGNSGAVTVDLEFLEAQSQLSATDSTGKIRSFSVDNSLTKPAIGSYGLFYERQDLLSPEPIASQVGRYQLGQSQVYFDAREFGGVPSTNSFFEPVGGAWLPQKREYGPVAPELLRTTTVGTPGKFLPPSTQPQRYTVANVSPLSQGNEKPDESPFPSLLGNLFKRGFRGSGTVGTYPYDKYAVEVVQGSSFSNVDYLWREFQRLYALKNGG